MTQDRPNPDFNLEAALYCEEEHWEEEEEDQEGCCNEGGGGGDSSSGCQKRSSCLLSLSEEDLFWEDDDLLSLFSKEKEQGAHTNLLSSIIQTEPFLSSARSEAVDWMLRVHAHYAFAALTAVLSVNYFDRFLSTIHFQKDKPWMAQLAAVACLSLAAKVEETQVPLLLDLQVEETKYVFEAKTIKRMELLVLSTLDWKMNPVTPISFIDHIIRRLGLKTQSHWEFLRRCERLILSVIADPRYICYAPSVLAAATMLHVIHQMEPCNPLQYENQLLGVLKICKEKLKDCFQLMVELVSGDGTHKRKYNISEPTTPNGVFDSFFSCQDSSNDSWASSFSPSSHLHLIKKRRVDKEVAVEQMHLPSLHYMFVDVLGSP